MERFDWQLKKPLNAVVFDCDSTLSQIEGIDFIAAKNGHGQAVHHLTERAMAMEGIGFKLYDERLKLVRPTHSHILSLVEDYYTHITPDAVELIQVLQQLGKTVYVVSAGIYQAVVRFAELLGVEQQHVHAVKLDFSENGDYRDFDQQSPMVRHGGKKTVVAELKTQHPRVAHIGDGMNDLEAISEAARFIGYGGACFREDIMQCCPFYVMGKSLASSLPLLLTAEEASQLNPAMQTIYQRGLEQIHQGGVVFNSHHHLFIK